MLGSFRRPVILAVFGMIGLAATTARAQEKVPPSKPATTDFGLPGEDPPKAFVPARPRTVEEQKRVEALRYFAVGRAFEERRQFGEALKSLEKAAECDPKSTTILRRLSLINFSLGREGSGIAFARKVLESDPGDVETIEMLIRHYKDDPGSAEALLNELSKNPKLAKNTVGALFVEFELGKILEASLKFDRAAEAFAKVIDALDDNSRVKLTASEVRRFLGNDEAQAYLRFGQVFLQAKKINQAIKAFRRGLVYDPDDPSLLYLLSGTYLEAGKPEEALGFVEQYLKRQPQGREFYDLLAKILASLKRENEIIPRLEKYADVNPKNQPLQTALAERYRAAGQLAKAQAIFAIQLGDQEFTDQFPRLLKEHKSEELLQLLARVYGRLKRFDAIQSQFDQLVADPAYADELVDVGMKMLASEPPTLDTLEGSNVLIKICYEGKRIEKLATLLRASIKRLPNPFFVYQELVRIDTQLGKYADAEAVWKEMMAKFPDERTAKMVDMLGEIQARAGKDEEAIVTYREALKLDPGDPTALRDLANLLIAVGKPDESLAMVRDAAKADPINPLPVFELSRILNKVGKPDEAIVQLRGLLERMPGDERVIRFAHSSLSSIYAEMNDFAKAEAELEGVFAKDPDDAGINNDLGYLYADQGKNLEKAESMIRRALLEEPDNFAYLDSLGWVLFKRGKFEEAIVPLEKALADSQADLTIPDHLGDVYFQLQETAKAKTAWERALKLAAEAKPVDKRYAAIQKKIQSLQQFVPAPKPKTGDKP